MLKLNYIFIFLGGYFMEKVIVVYKSKYGSTKKYAQWLAEDLSCDLVENKK